MPIDASRNPYDSPRFDAPGSKGVVPGAVGKDEVDDELDDALDELGASTKAAVGAAAVDDLDDDLGATKGDLDADLGADDDLDLAGTGAKGELALDDLDQLGGPDVKAFGAGLGDAVDDLDDVDDLDGLDALDGDALGVKGAAFDFDDDDLADDGGVFGADLGEVPDLDATKGAFDDDDLLDPDQKGSILDAVADAMRAEHADDDLDVDL